MFTRLSWLILSPILAFQGLWVRVKTPRLPEPKGARDNFSSMDKIRSDPPTSNHKVTSLKKTNHKKTNYKKHDDKKHDGEKPFNKKPHLSFLVIGDSAAAGVGVKDQSSALTGQIYQRLAQRFNCRWKLNAWTGCTTDDMLKTLKTSDSDHYDVVITSLGVNDLITGVRVAKWVEQQRALIIQLKSVFTPKLIIISELPEMGEFPALPQPLRWALGQRAKNFNRALKDLVAAQNDVALIQLDIAETALLMATDGFHPGAGAYELWAEACVQLILQKIE